MIRDYNVTYRTGSGDRPYAHVFVDDTTLKTYGKLPTIEEAIEYLGSQVDYVDLTGCFSDCSNMLASPSISASYYDGNDVFADCTSLLVAPTFFRPGTTSTVGDSFENCTGLLQAAVIPDGEASLYGFYRGCSALISPVSIPPNAKSISYIYENCINLTGEFIVRGRHTKTNSLKGTVKDLVIYGDKTQCEALAATANNGNASWQPWYDPVPAVTNRGQGSYTTAEDMTRMVRNGALAVDTFAPGRMVYHQGDIVRADEWNALVEAAQTIDPTVTYSTHYANLNKIEAAFDSAL